MGIILWVIGLVQWFALTYGIAFLVYHTAWAGEWWYQWTVLILVLIALIEGLVLFMVAPMLAMEN